MQVYADNAATTRMSDKAVAAMTPYFQQFYGNPSSLHTVGQQAAEALADARRRVADCLGCSFKEITFLRRQRGRQPGHRLGGAHRRAKGQEAHHLHRLRAPRGAAHTEEAGKRGL